MIAKTILKIGGKTYQFEFENAVEMEAIHRSIALSNYPTYCNVCKTQDTEDDFHLTTNKDKEGNIYANLKHNNCGGKVKLGQYKQGGYFWHREFEVYKKGQENEEPR